MIDASKHWTKFTHILERRQLLAKSALLRIRAPVCIRRMSESAATAPASAQSSGGFKRLLTGFAIGILASVYVFNSVYYFDTIAA